MELTDSIENDVYFYLFDLQNVYIDCNVAFANAMFLNSVDDIIGRKNQELHCFQNRISYAQIIDSNNKQIITSEESMVFEGGV